MSSMPVSCERIDLQSVDDVRDVVHRAVASLVLGGVVVVPGECGPIPLASALNPGALASLDRVGPRRQSARPALLLSSASALGDWVPGISPKGLKLARRVWPGSVTLAFDGPKVEGLAGRLPAEARERWEFEGRRSFRSPAHPFIWEALSLLPCPLLTLGELDRKADDGPLDGIALLVEERTSRPEEASTVIRVDGDDWSILQPGSVSGRELATMSGTMILFVCTGNTCRSPMAEALCKALLARRLKCNTDELIDRGFVVLSAGVGAVEGKPAAANATEVVKSRGGSLDSHASRQITPELIRDADHIITMTGEHLDILLEFAPEVADRARLLHPEGYDVEDPIGSDRENYRRTAEAIESYLARLIDDLGLDRKA